MPRLSLHKVGSNGRIQLGDYAKQGDFYSVDLGHDDDGNDTIVLTKVDVITTGGQRAAGDPDDV